MTRAEGPGALWPCYSASKQGGLPPPKRDWHSSTKSRRHLAFFGASITVLLLLFDPFLQQVVIYPDRLVAAERAATIVRAQRYQARSDEGLPLPSTVDISMKVFPRKEKV